MNSQEKEMLPFPVIRKRDGRLTRFDLGKIEDALYKAFYANNIGNKDLSKELALKVVQELCKDAGRGIPQVEEIQDVVEQILIKEGYGKVAKSYILYRAKRNSVREGKSQLMDGVEAILEETRKGTPFSSNSPGSKMLKIAVSASRSYYLTRLIPSQFAEAHNRGDIHIHDLDYYCKTINSLQIPLKKLLEQGFSSGYGFIRPPRRVSTLGALTTIILQACQNDMYGGQAIPEFDIILGEYIKNHIKREVIFEDIYQMLQGLVYNLNMIYSRLGATVPQSSISVGLGTSPESRMITQALLQVLEDGLGCHETPLHPWVIFYVKEGINLNAGDPNRDLYLKAVQTASRRMNPTFVFMDNSPNQGKNLIAYWGDGSRIEEPERQEEDHPQEDGKGMKGNHPWGIGSIAQVTINLPRLAFKIAHKRKDYPRYSIFRSLDSIIELCAHQLLHRREILSHLHVSELPFIAGEGIYKGSQGLEDEDNIEPLLNQGVMNIGFVGLTESLRILTGRDHFQSEDSLKLGLDMIGFMSNKIGELSKKYGVKFLQTASSSGYSVQRFPILDAIEFGHHQGINYRPYYSQAFSPRAGSFVETEKRLDVESRFYPLTPGGHFTFIETLNPPPPERYMEVLEMMRNKGIAYGGVSFPISDLLQKGEKTRTLRRTAGILLPLEHINSALREELTDRKEEIL